MKPPALLDTINSDRYFIEYSATMPHECVDEKLVFTGKIFDMKYGPVMID